MPIEHKQQSDALTLINSRIVDDHGVKDFPTHWLDHYNTSELFRQLREYAEYNQLPKRFNPQTLCEKIKQTFDYYEEIELSHAEFPSTWIENSAWIENNRSEAHKLPNDIRLSFGRKILSMFSLKKVFLFQKKTYYIGYDSLTGYSDIEYHMDPKHEEQQIRNNEIVEVVDQYLAYVRKANQLLPMTAESVEFAVNHLSFDIGKILDNHTYLLEHLFNIPQKEALDLLEYLYHQSLLVNSETFLARLLLEVSPASKAVETLKKQSVELANCLFGDKQIRINAQKSKFSISKKTCSIQLYYATDLLIHILADHPNFEPTIVKSAEWIHYTKTPITMAKSTLDSLPLGYRVWTTTQEKLQERVESREPGLLYNFDHIKIIEE